MPRLTDPLVFNLGIHSSNPTIISRPDVMWEGFYQGFPLATFETNNEKKTYDIRI